MTTNINNLIKSLAVAALVAVTGASVTHAATLQFANPGSATARAEVTCSSCEVWYISDVNYSAENWGAGFWNGEGPGPDGTLFSRGLVDGNGNNPSARLELTNLVLETTYTADDPIETGGNESNWTSSAEVLIVWTGTQGNPNDSYRYAFIRNYAANNQFTWNGLPGGGGGKSGYNGYGEVPPIPLPAAGWLLVGGLGGLALMRRRRKAV